MAEQKRIRNKRVLCLLLLVGFVMETVAEEAEEQFRKKLTIFNDKTLEKDITPHKHLILFFTATWCKECPDIEAELEESQWLLDQFNLHYVVGKVDVTGNKEVAKKYSLQGIPAYQIFKKGKLQSHLHGSPRSHEVLRYVIQHSGMPILPITCSLIDQHPPSLHRSIVYVGDVYDKEYLAFQEVSLLESEGQKFNYFTLSEKSCKESLKVTKEPTILAFRNKFNTQPAVYTGHFSKETIVSWIWNRMTPPSFELSQDTYELLLNQKDLPQLHLFRQIDPEKVEKFEEVFDKIGKKNSEEFIFVKNSLQNDFQRQIAKYIGVKESELPSIIITDGERFKKFKYPGSVAKMNEKQLLKFLIAFDDDKLKPFYRSGAVPEKNDGFVKVVVSDTYRELVKENKDDFFMMYTIEWSKDSDRLMPVFEDLAKELKDVPNLKFGTYDLTENDPIEETVKNYPDFILCEKNTKHTKDFRYELSEVTLDGLKEFLKLYSTSYQQYLGIEPTSKEGGEL